MANEIATWLNKGYAEKLVKAATGYWEQSRNYVMWAVQQKDELQNEEPILGLLAWERLTQRLNSEPLDLYRKRVQHALVNTIDAGELATLQKVNELLPEIISLYGRTCRRYQFSVHNKAPVYLSLGATNLQNESHKAPLFPVQLNVIHNLMSTTHLAIINQERSVSFAKEQL